MNSSSVVEGPLLGKGAVCEPVLRSLPDWFGIEEAIVRYGKEIDNLPTFLVHDGETLVGFLSVKQHFPRSAEVYVMGVRQEAHRCGVGRALMQAAQKWLQEQGAGYLQVKTLSPTRSSEHYERTRAFYEKMGFEPLEELKTLWGEDNPCLLLVKKI
jgi:ribosomal protein S18 acetylase RimI-like enzyme